MPQRVALLIIPNSALGFEAQGNMSRDISCSPCSVVLAMSRRYGTKVKIHASCLWDLVKRKTSLLLPLQCMLKG